MLIEVQTLVSFCIVKRARGKLLGAGEVPGCILVGYSGAHVQNGTQVHTSDRLFCPVIIMAC